MALAGAIGPSLNERVMVRIESGVFVEGITARQVYDFMLDCDDDRYRRWWPGTHLQFHCLKRGATDHVGDLVYMDEYVGRRRVRMRATVEQAVAGRKIVWRFRLWLLLPARLSIELADHDGGITLRHTIRAGFAGPAQVLDPLLRLYFSRRFAAAMDDHVRTEFPLLCNQLTQIDPARYGPWGAVPTP
jgi:hypothetical protein